MLTLLTVIGDRPEAWELCKRWMKAQDYDEPVTWVVVDTGESVPKLVGFPEGWYVVAVQTNTKMGYVAAARMALGYSDSDNLVIIDDTAHYGPGWLSHCARGLEKFDLIGESGAPYFDLRHVSFMRCKNQAFSKLCATALKGDALALFVETYTAVDLWDRFLGSKQLTRAKHVVGIMGLPGTRPSSHVWGVTDAATLQTWLGDDVTHYL